MVADAGIVRIHAQTICPATPQRTALSRRVAPTPTMAPVIVCVVLMPTPSAVAVKIATAAPVSAAKPPAGCSFVIFVPIVLMIRQPPLSVPSPIAVCDSISTQNGTSNVARISARHQRARDDAHRLLRVVGAVHQAVGRGGDQLQPAEPAIDARGRRVAEDPVDRRHHDQPDDEADERRDDDEDQRLGPAGDDDGAEARLGDGRAGVAAEQRVRRARRQPEVPRDQVPRDRADQAGEDHRVRHDRRDRPCRSRRSWPRRCRRRIAATKLKNAAHATACSGDSTRVETTVAIELAAS